MKAVQQNHTPRVAGLAAGPLHKIFMANQSLPFMQGVESSGSAIKLEEVTTKQCRVSREHPEGMDTTT